MPSAPAGFAPRAADCRPCGQQTRHTGRLAVAAAWFVKAVAKTSIGCRPQDTDVCKSQAVSRKQRFHSACTAAQHADLSAMPPPLPSPGVSSAPPLGRAPRCPAPPPPLQAAMRETAPVALTERSSRTRVSAAADRAVGGKCSPPAAGRPPPTPAVAIGNGWRPWLRIFSMA